MIKVNVLRGKPTGKTLTVIGCKLQTVDGRIMLVVNHRDRSGRFVRLRYDYGGDSEL